MKAAAGICLIRSDHFFSGPHYLIVWYIQHVGLVFMFFGCEGGDDKVQFDGLPIFLGYCFYYLLCSMSVNKIFIYIMHHIIFQLR